MSARQSVAPSPSIISIPQTSLATVMALRLLARHDSAFGATARMSPHGRALPLHPGLPAEPAKTLRNTLYVGRRGNQHPRWLSWPTRRLNLTALPHNAATTIEYLEALATTILKQQWAIDEDPLRETDWSDMRRLPMWLPGRLIAERRC